MVNQGSAEIALGVDNNENNPREENSHRLHLVASIAAHLYCTSQSGTCYFLNLGYSRSGLTSLSTHLLWECHSLGKSGTIVD